MKFPPDYPYSPPSIRFMTKVWHPNVYEVSEYIRELSIPRVCSLCPFRPFPLIRVYVRILPCVPFPFICPLSPSPLPSLSLSVSVTLLSPRSHRLSLYNDRPALSASLYLPPSAAIAFTTISFYIVTFSACETTRAVQTPGPSLPSRRNGRTDGKGKKKRK